VDGIDTPPRGQRDAQKMNGDAEQPRSTGRRATAEAMANEAARDLGERVLHQEPPPARLRQPAQGAAHRGQGGRRQQPRRLRGGAHPARHRVIRASAQREAVTDDRRGQRPRHREGAGPERVRPLLYGSKFHRLRQSRGQQGIGISAAGMYGQLTTGRPVRGGQQAGKRARRGLRDPHRRAQEQPRGAQQGPIDRGRRTTAPRCRSSSWRASTAGPEERRGVPQADGGGEPARAPQSTADPDGNVTEYQRAPRSCRRRSRRSSRTRTASSSACC
jgi:hypothetical protein